jgi:hypothetical protein
MFEHVADGNNHQGPNHFERRKTSRLGVRSALLRCFFLTLVIFPMLVQFHHVYFMTRMPRLQHASMQTFRAPNGTSSKTPFGQGPQFFPSNQTVQGFGACLMIKDDTDLLYEWLAYHVTMLPLRYVVVGLDVNNSQDPTPILQRYTEITHLRFVVWNVSDVDNSIIPSKNTTGGTETAHHTLIQRQKDFVHKCFRFLRRQRVGWTALIDTDEFVVWNPVGGDESQLLERLGPVTDLELYQLRMSLSAVEPGTSLLSETSTVWQSLTSWQRNHVLPHETCYTMPRLLIGSFENTTCSPRAEDIRKQARVFGEFPRDHRRRSQSGETQKNASLQHSSNRRILQTLQYMHHAPKGDFASNKFGKVLLDISRIPEYMLQSKSLRNIHRPYKDLCGPAVSHFLSAPLIVHHYLGSWDRYRARPDARRNRHEWSKRAGFYVENDSQSVFRGFCENVVRWFPRFVAAVGDGAGQYLLGISDLTRSTR